MLPKTCIAHSQSQITTLVKSIFKTRIVALSLGVTLGLSANGLARADSVDVEQQGLDNSASTYQSTNYSSAIARVKQVGDRNIVGLVESSRTLTGIEQSLSTAASASISQLGDDNAGLIHQYLSTDPIGTITQEGNGNFAMIEQEEGTTKTATVTQGKSTGSGTMDNGSAFVVQYGTGYETAVIEQYGTNHNAHATQRGAGTSSADQLTITITQSGDNHWADVEQYGVQLLGTVGQSGDTNKVVISQDGSYMTATATQSGNFSYADIDQTGSRHSATVVQYGSSLFGSGYSNYVYITQSGTDHSARATQSGSGNTITTRQY